MLNGVVFIRWSGGLFYAKYPQFSLGECRNNSKWCFLLWCFFDASTLWVFFYFFSHDYKKIVENSLGLIYFYWFLRCQINFSFFFHLFTRWYFLMFWVCSRFDRLSTWLSIILFILLYSPFEILVCKSNVSQFPWNFITFRSFHWYEFDDLRL